MLKLVLQLLEKLKMQAKTLQLELMLVLDQKALQLVLDLKALQLVLNLKVPQQPVLRENKPLPKEKPQLKKVRLLLLKVRLQLRKPLTRNLLQNEKQLEPLPF